MKMKSLEQMKDELIGKVGTKERDKYEKKLKKALKKDAKKTQLQKSKKLKEENWFKFLNLDLNIIWKNKIRSFQLRSFNHITFLPATQENSSYKLENI